MPLYASHYRVPSGIFMNDISLSQLSHKQRNKFYVQFVIQSFEFGHFFFSFFIFAGRRGAWEEARLWLQFYGSVMENPDGIASYFLVAHAISNYWWHLLFHLSAIALTENIYRRLYASFVRAQIDIENIEEWFYHRKRARIQKRDYPITMILSLLFELFNCEKKENKRAHIICI